MIRKMQADGRHRVGIPYLNQEMSNILAAVEQETGDLALAQTVVYLALAPKSNAVYTAFDRALEVSGKTGTAPVPPQLRNAPTALLKGLGYGRGYRYPHDAPEGWLPAHYFPETITAPVFYHPTPRGWEGQRREMLTKRRQMVTKLEEPGTPDPKS